MNTTNQEFCKAGLPECQKYKDVENIAKILLKNNPEDENLQIYLRYISDPDKTKYMISKSEEERKKIFFGERKCGRFGICSSEAKICYACALDYSVEFVRLYNQLNRVFNRILQDGYDISEFVWVDSFTYEAFCFANSKLPYDPRLPETKEFDVYTNWSGKAVIGYMKEHNGILWFHKARSIQEAIEKYDCFNH